MSEEPTSCLRAELAALLNRHSQENGSDTPDHILAEYLMGSLAAFDAAVQARDNWWGIAPSGRLEEG